jgi:ribosome-binding protein aMBF1 (putative translation factor)
MTKLILDEEAAKLIREKAEQRGYNDPTAYLLDLVAADNEEEDKQFPDNHAIRESFKRGFKEALQGKGMSREEFERRLAEDEQ